MADLPTDKADQKDDDQGRDGHAAGQDDEGRTHDLLHEVGRVEHLNLHGVVHHLADVAYKRADKSFKLLIRALKPGTKKLTLNKAIAKL